MYTGVTAEPLLTAKALRQIVSLSERQVFPLNSCGEIPAPNDVGRGFHSCESTTAAPGRAGGPNPKSFDAMQETQKWARM